MKTKHLIKKLSLNRQTIANLSSKDMKDLMAGQDRTTIIYSLTIPICGGTCNTC
jgi:natural product precursor